MHIKLLVLPFQKKCIGHVQKRVSAALRKLKRESPGLGGKGKLTDGTVVKLQSYYGIAIRSNVEFDGNEKSHLSQRTHKEVWPLWCCCIFQYGHFCCYVLKLFDALGIPPGKVTAAGCQQQDHTRVHLTQTKSQGDIKRRRKVLRGQRKRKDEKRNDAEGPNYTSEQF